MTSGLLQHKDAIQFILAGKSFITFLNTKTENRFTFKIVRHKENPIYFVNVLTNPDTYAYIGIIDSDFNFKHSRKSKISPDAQSVKVFTYVFNHLKTNTLTDIIEIYHSGRCGKCGKHLTTPNSINLGYGPDCIKRV